MKTAIINLIWVEKMVHNNPLNPQRPVILLCKRTIILRNWTDNFLTTVYEINYYYSAPGIPVKCSIIRKKERKTMNHSKDEISAKGEKIEISERRNYSGLWETVRKSWLKMNLKLGPEKSVENI